jgi:hypothetical protein
VRRTLEYLSNLSSYLICHPAGDLAQQNSPPSEELAAAPKLKVIVRDNMVAEIWWNGHLMQNLISDSYDNVATLNGFSSSGRFGVFINGTGTGQIWIEQPEFRRLPVHPQQARIGAR